MNDISVRSSFGVPVSWENVSTGRKTCLSRFIPPEVTVIGPGSNPILHARVNDFFLKFYNQLTFWTI